MLNGYNVDTETLKSLAELGYAFILIAWLMRTNLSLTQRLRDIQDRFFTHLEADIKDVREGAKERD